MEPNKNQLREETIDFAIAVSDVCDNICGCSVFVNQLLRFSSSIGSNVHEAKYAQSRADFINELEIALKESSETDYWLELLYRKKKTIQRLFLVAEKPVWNNSEKADCFRHNRKSKWRYFP